MKFSIITVCYNAPPNAIDLTLASIHGQEGVEIEHIVIDGASRPETRGSER